MKDELEKKGRKRVVVEEVEAPVSSEVVSSPEISEEAAKTEVPETPEEEIGHEIHEEEKHLHDIHTETNLPNTPEKKPGNPVWWIIIPGIFLLGALLGGIVFYQKGINKGEDLTATPTPSALDSTETASPTPAAQMDLTKFQVNILNGSGIAGEASRAKDLLTAAGFKVSGTGNASSYSFTKTVIKAKSDVDSAFLTKLSETLGKSYSLDKAQTLSDSSSDDVQVVVGSSKAQ